MNTKDKFAVIKNPKKFLFSWEVWVSGPAAYIDAHGDIQTKTITRCISSCRTEMQAELEIQYQVDVAEFKGAV